MADSQTEREADSHFARMGRMAPAELTRHDAALLGNASPAELRAALAAANENSKLFIAGVAVASWAQALAERPPLVATAQGYAEIAQEAAGIPLTTEY